MKTAICFACTGRSIEYTFDNLKKYLIDDFKQRDIFVYLAKTSYTENVLKYFSTLENCYVYVQEEHPIDISQYNFPPNWPPTDKDLDRNSDKGRQIFLQMLKSRSYINTILKEANKKYDRVIFSRIDVLYEKSVSEQIENLDLSKIWVPNFHNWLDGYNDRFAISSMENMIDYFSLYDYIEQYKKEQTIFHAESLLKHHLDSLKKEVDFFNLYFARIRPNGTMHDDFHIIRNEAVKV